MVWSLQDRLVAGLFALIMWSFVLLLIGLLALSILTDDKSFTFVIQSFQILLAIGIGSLAVHLTRRMLNLPRRFSVRVEALGPDPTDPDVQMYQRVLTPEPHGPLVRYCYGVIGLVCAALAVSCPVVTVFRLLPPGPHRGATAEILLTLFVSGVGGFVAFRLLRVAQGHPPEPTIIQYRVKPEPRASEAYADEGLPESTIAYAPAPPPPAYSAFSRVAYGLIAATCWFLVIQEGRYWRDGWCPGYPLSRVAVGLDLHAQSRRKGLMDQIGCASPHHIGAGRNADGSSPCSRRAASSTRLNHVSPSTIASKWRTNTPGSFGPIAVFAGNSTHQ